MKINMKQTQNIEFEMLKEIVSIFNRNNITYFLAYGSALGAIRHNGPIPWDSDLDIVIPIVQLDKAVDCLKKELSKKFCIHDINRNKKYKQIFPRVGLKHTSSDYIHIDLFPLIGIPSEKGEQYRFIKKINKIVKIYTIDKNFRLYKIANINTLKNIIGRFMELFVPPISKNRLRKIYKKLSTKYDYEICSYVINPITSMPISPILKKDYFNEMKFLNYLDLQVPVPAKCEELLEQIYGDYMKLPSNDEIQNQFIFKTEINLKDYENLKEII